MALLILGHRLDNDIMLGSLQQATSAWMKNRFIVLWNVPLTTFPKIQKTQAQKPRENLGRYQYLKQNTLQEVAQRPAVAKAISNNEILL